MITVWLIALPFIGAVLAWLSTARDRRWAPWICLAALLVDLGLVLALWAVHFTGNGSPGNPWAEQLDVAWIPQIGIRFHLALDGLSLLLVGLTDVLGMVAVAASWKEIEERTGFFYFSLMWVLGATIAVFLAIDLFLFYFAWEFMLVPMYLLIALWGHERRLYASVKFFLFTQLSGLLMLIAILALYFIHGNATGDYTFDYNALLGTHMSEGASVIIMLGFVAAFAVKLPAFPLHTWLPDAHTEAPTAGSVVLAGLLLKTGAYGLIRFAIPLFPKAAADFAPYAMALAVLGILYGALLTFVQRDFKRLVAYTSVSHMGFALLGIYAWNSLALQGVVLQLLCHGLATGALFVIAGLLQERTHTRQMHRFGGLWSTAPKMGGATMFFSLGAMGLPGLGSFLGEFLILAGTYEHHRLAAVLASLGLIGSTVYALWLVQRVFHGPNEAGWTIADLGAREQAVLGVMAAGLLWLGLYPQPVIDIASSTLQTLQTVVAPEQMVGHPGASQQPPAIQASEYNP